MVTIIDVQPKQISNVFDDVFESISKRLKELNPGQEIKIKFENLTAREVELLEFKKKKNELHKKCKIYLFSEPYFFTENKEGDFYLAKGKDEERI